MNLKLNLFFILVVLLLTKNIYSSYRVYNRVQESVVRIKVTNDDGSLIAKSSFATGFVIDRKGVVMTAAHIFNNKKDGRTTVKIIIDELNIFNAAVRIISDSDIAILNIIENNQLNFNPIRTSRRAPLTGEEIFSVGFPLFEILQFSKPVIYRGILNSVETYLSVKTYEGPYYYSDIYANSGSSGSPVVNRRGELIGMVQSVLSDDKGKWNNATFIFPINRDLIDGLRIDGLTD